MNFVDKVLLLSKELTQLEEKALLVRKQLEELIRRPKTEEPAPSSELQLVLSKATGLNGAVPRMQVLEVMVQDAFTNHAARGLFRAESFPGLTPEEAGSALRSCLYVGQVERVRRGVYRLSQDFLERVEAHRG